MTSTYFSTEIEAREELARQRLLSRMGYVLQYNEHRFECRSWPESDPTAELRAGMFFARRVA